jgi:hypothetical protein
MKTVQVRIKPEHLERIIDLVNNDPDASDELRDLTAKWENSYLSDHPERFTMSCLTS